MLCGWLGAVLRTSVTSPLVRLPVRGRGLRVTDTDGNAIVLV